MFRPRTPLAQSLKRTTSRSNRCALYVDPFDLRMPETEAQDLLELLEEQIEQREEMVKFLEDQVRAWSLHPSASTWSQPQIDN